MITLYALPMAAKKDRAKIVITCLILDSIYIIPTIISNL
jgi:hypothetical protein